MVALVDNGGRYTFQNADGQAFMCFSFDTGWVV